MGVRLPKRTAVHNNSAVIWAIHLPAGPEVQQNNTIDQNGCDFCNEQSQYGATKLR